MLEAHGKQICTWRYPAPYDCYNWSSWEQMMRDEAEFADPAIRQLQYAVTLDEDGQVSGYVQYFPITGVTRLGLGLRPDLCDQGHSHAFLTAIINEARHRNPDHEIDLEVLTWNKRAIQAYEKVGFVITDTYERGSRAGLIEVHCMVWIGK
ncbi:GNAT family N-acetyltransferase [Paenibacillus sp. N1-5-1-14]|uniref:GNAT family N-acetyltransferase n=1 Tax=Paenibacillus radicibacter TaxID=2972488 RepID=UPI0021596E85|nr:GNAT family N-acetyltransferase [Paenibacillus radicibacter]MCR8642599.1 GNAT family N-acetyltransferase [Paenibacillus radicibacter]